MSDGHGFASLNGRMEKAPQTSQPLLLSDFCADRLRGFQSGPLARSLLQVDLPQVRTEMAAEDPSVELL